MNKDLYTILWISKDTTEDDIKKAYRKLAMKYHPDKAPKWKKKEYEEKFKEINEAYSILSDPEKKKQYDMFWSVGWGGFSWWMKWNPFWWWFAVDLEDLFWWMWWSWWKTYYYTTSNNMNKWNYSNNVDLEDLFWDLFWKRKNTNTQRAYSQEKENLDIEKKYKVPYLDFILWGILEVKSYYWEKKKIKIKKGTKPCSKLRVKWYWKKWRNWEIWNLIVELDVEMPKNLSETVLWLFKKIKDLII